MSDIEGRGVGFLKGLLSSSLSLSQYHASTCLTSEMRNLFGSAYPGWMHLMPTERRASSVWRLASERPRVSVSGHSRFWTRLLSPLFSLRHRTFTHNNRTVYHSHYRPTRRSSTGRCTEYPSQPSAGSIYRRNAPSDAKQTASKPRRSRPRPHPPRRRHHRRVGPSFILHNYKLTSPSLLLTAAIIRPLLGPTSWLASSRHPTGFTPLTSYWEIRDKPIPCL